MNPGAAAVVMRAWSLDTAGGSQRSGARWGWSLGGTAGAGRGGARVDQSLGGSRVPGPP